MAPLATPVSIALTVFIWLLIARVVIDLVQNVSTSWRPRGAMLWLAEVTYTVTDPPMKFLRRFIPPLRIGPVMLDLAFLILLLGAQMLRQVVEAFR